MKDLYFLFVQTGTVIGTDLAVEHMRKDKNGKGGTIINIASTAGLKKIASTAGLLMSRESDNAVCGKGQV